MEFSISIIVIFCVIYFLEAVLTLLGNSFTIFVFWKRRAELKRTSYLLVNLAFADLLVALSISFLVGSGISLNWVLIINVTLDTFCGIASLISLLVISLERLYAVRWPFRHRTLSTSSYIYGLAFVWVIAGIMFLFDLVSLLWFSVYSRLSTACDIITTSLVFLALVIICAAYMYIIIHQQSLQGIPESLNERRALQNRKLTNTLFIVTILSVICWLPLIIFWFVFIFTSASTDNNNLYHGLLIVKAFQNANSIVNP